MSIQVVHNSDVAAPNQITTYLHCSLCLEEWQTKFRGTMAPKDYARTQTGFTEKGHIQVWCNRHDCNVDLMTIREKE